MSLKFPVNNFKWVEDISKFNYDFMKSYKKNFLEVDVQYPENLDNLHNVLFFFLKECKPEIRKVCS